MLCKFNITLNEGQNSIRIKSSLKVDVYIRP